MLHRAILQPWAILHPRHGRVCRIGPAMIVHAWSTLPWPTAALPAAPRRAGRPG